MTQNYHITTSKMTKIDRVRIKKRFYFTDIQQNINVKGSINNPFENLSTDELREVLNNLENE